MTKYYSELGLTRKELLEKIKAQMSNHRFKHVLSVEETARKLAKIYGVDEDKAALAGLLHDYAKELSEGEFKKLIARYELDPDLLNWGNNVWHGMVGIYKIKEDLGLEDADILEAIRIHTVGSASMTTLAKIVYVADYIEPHRDFPGVDKARKLAKKDLDAAVAFETQRTVEHLLSKKVRVYPQTIETYNAYISYLK
ncbi:bis(5'-nucleosyl)-tetraphosphatase (symmetrical) YqeK [Streptococcaceae bacterium ESL0729]|nr:bis(5'-nucleosyl)-tetraphosphatase (symmetrical) YqeK [Streptococcaceae bacterium ESL0729]